MTESLVATALMPKLGTHNNDNNNNNETDIPLNMENMTLWSYFNMSMFPGLDNNARARDILSQPHTIVVFVLCIVTIAANAASLIAMTKVRGELTTHFRLIISLAASDILVSCSVLLHFLNHAFNPTLPVRWPIMDDRIRSQCMFVFDLGLNTTAHIISLLNLMGMALDHYLAILKPLHYCTLMNKQRGVFMIILLWIIAFICGMSDFLVGLVGYSERHKKVLNFCEYIELERYQPEYATFFIALVCLLVMMTSYLRIYNEVRKRQLHCLPGNQEVCARNRKALITTLFILGTFCICWIPTCLFQISLVIQAHINTNVLQEFQEEFLNATEYLYDLLLLNSLLDPIIYAIRMREVRLGYKKAFSCQDRKDPYTMTHFSLLDSDRKQSRYSLSIVYETHLWFV